LPIWIRFFIALHDRLRCARTFIATVETLKMKSSAVMFGLLLALNACDCSAALISSSAYNIRFLNAVPGVPTENEPLRFSVDTGHRVVLLDLGQYSSADVGKTLTFMRQAPNDDEWESIATAMRGDSVTGTGESTMWLGLEPSPIDYRDLTQGFPDYNLQRIDIYPRYFRTGIDGGNTFRAADFTAVFYWGVIPEPATAALVMSAVLVLMFRLSDQRGIYGRS
jgi:hypothetical protein